jgi:hypothetical protein
VADYGLLRIASTLGTFAADDWHVLMPLEGGGGERERGEERGMLLELLQGCAHPHTHTQTHTHTLRACAHSHTHTHSLTHTHTH